MGLALLSSACFGGADPDSSSSDVEVSTDEVATFEEPNINSDDAAETPTTTIEVVDFSGMTSDPVVNALLSAQLDDPALGMLIESPEDAEVHECVTTMLLDGIGIERFTELVAMDDGGYLDHETMYESEIEMLAQASSTCGDSGKLLLRLVLVDDPQLAGCIVEKISSTGRTSDLVSEIAIAGDLEASNIIPGFRYTCQQTWLEEQFGQLELGGTANEDLGNVSSWLLDDLLPMEQLGAFERTCVLWGTKEAVGVDWAWVYLRRSEENRQVRAIDYLLTISGEEEQERIFDGVRASIVTCVDRFKLVQIVGELDFLAPRTVGCLRDRLLDEEMDRVLNFLIEPPVSVRQSADLDAAWSVIGDRIALCGALYG